MNGDRAPRLLDWRLGFGACQAKIIHVIPHDCRNQTSCFPLPLGSHISRLQECELPSSRLSIIPSGSCNFEILALPSTTSIKLSSEWADPYTRCLSRSVYNTSERLGRVYRSVQNRCIIEIYLCILWTGIIKSHVLRYILTCEPRITPHQSLRFNKVL